MNFKNQSCRLRPQSYSLEGSNLISFWLSLWRVENAAHLIRLLRMGIEFMKDGHLHVRRTDAAELLHIKRGGWTLEQVKSEAEHLFKEAEEVYQSSPLPEKPDEEAINQLTVKAAQMELLQRGEI